MDKESDIEENNLGSPVIKKSKDGVEKKFRGPMAIYYGHGKVRSRYRSAPIGSCHDLCKYGRKHECQEEERHLIFRKFMANSIPSDAVQTNVKVLSVGDGRKSSGPKKKALSRANCKEQKMLPERQKVGMLEKSLVDESISCSPEAMQLITSEQQTGLLAEELVRVVPLPTTNAKGEPLDEVIVAKVPEKMKSHVTFIKFEENMISEDASSIELSASKERGIGTFPRVIVPESPHVNANCVAFSDSSKSTKTRLNKQKKKTLSSLADTDSSDSNILKDKVEFEMNESLTSAEAKVIKQMNRGTRTPSAYPKLQCLQKNALVSSRKTDGSFKLAIPLKARTPLSRLESQFNCSKGLNCPGKRREKAVEDHEAIKIAGMKLLKAKKTLLLKEDIDDINAKVYQGIGMNTDSVTDNHETLKNRDDPHASRSANSEALELSDNEQTKSKQHYGPSKEDKKRSRKTLAVQPGESSSNPYKMKFKRGRVVEVCSANTAVPRKLRFRRGRVLGENPNGEFPKRIFRRRRDSGESNDPNSAASLTVMSKQHNSEAQGVMLKHQDARGKKDLQALFNHVIEETASKLVETRKSKVKALVGAFETVISLQETKPVSTG